MKLKSRRPYAAEVIDVMAAADDRAATLGQEVVRLRVSAGMSQHDLADASGLKRSNIAMIETTDGMQPGSAALFALSDALGVAVEHWRPYLTAQPPEPPPPPSRGKLK